jgi:uncharacterized repeat protein (TIGR03803 family)
MRSEKLLRVVCMFAVVALVLLATTRAWSASYKVLYDFNSTNRNPSSGLITDAAGNGYGTTAGGGHDESGTVYELSPTTGYHLLYAFSNGSGGRQPQGNLAFDSAGNLYGTTIYGGVDKTCGGGVNGCGVVFKLTPPSNGGLWTETVLYSFCSQANCADGAFPQAGVIFDSSGNLYATTLTGGNQNCNEEGPGCGTVFELQPSQTGWTESVLYVFGDNTADGHYPRGSLVFDGAGNLYGTASVAGPGAGSAFRLTPSGEGWTFSVIYAFEQFSRQDGNQPEAGMVFDTAGNLYGTTAGGGQFGFGTVFELTLSSGIWTETILYNFAGGNDGAEPKASLVIDSAGSLYGTTFDGGGPPKRCGNGGCGIVFKLTPEAGGQWTESLFRFGGVLGLQPSASVLLDPAGNVYGTTTGGGSHGAGVVFRISQSAH